MVTVDTVFSLMPRTGFSSAGAVAAAGTGARTRFGLGVARRLVLPLGVPTARFGMDFLLDRAPTASAASATR
jgi:hypothetical protein